MTSAILTRFNQPAYTGENRCLPCTAVNLLIAGILSGLLALWSPWVGLFTFLCCVLIIYVRGYLIPGTPEFTKRYLPERVHRLFGTHAPVPTASESPVDIEAELTDGGVIIDAGADLELAQSFKTAWDEAIARVGTETLTQTLGAFLETDDPLIIEDRETRTIVKGGGRQLGNWESQAALIADVAAHQTLIALFPPFLKFDVETRARMVGAIRVFLDTCPTCGGAVEVGNEIVESCCRAFDVVAFSCDECGVRLAEFELVETAG